MFWLLPSLLTAVFQRLNDANCDLTLNCETACDRLPTFVRVMRIATVVMAMWCGLHGLASSPPASLLLRPT